MEPRPLEQADRLDRGRLGRHHLRPVHRCRRPIRSPRSNFNYTIVAVAVVLGGAWLWWATSAKNWFTGPRQNIDGAVLADAAGVPVPRDVPVRPTWPRPGRPRTRRTATTRRCNTDRTNDAGWARLSRPPGIGSRRRPRSAGMGEPATVSVERADGEARPSVGLASRPSVRRWGGGGVASGARRQRVRDHGRPARAGDPARHGGGRRPAAARARIGRAACRSAG